MKLILGFLRFWYDFLVGDSIALAIGGVAVLALGYLLVESGGNLAAELALPVVAIGAIVASLPRPGGGS